MKIRRNDEDDIGAHVGKGAAWLVWYVLAIIAVVTFGVVWCSTS